MLRLFALAGDWVTYIPPSGIATIYTPRRFYIFMRRTNPFEPLEPLEPAEPLSHAIKGRSAPGANPEVDSLLSTFPSAIFFFLRKNCKFQGFWWANFPLYGKMRRTKGQRWDKVGLSRMRDRADLGLTIGQGSKCIKCERNDNMGDRVIHNLLIILKCLLGRYKIDN